MSNLILLLLLTLIPLSVCLFAFRQGSVWLAITVATLYVITNIVAAQIVTITLPILNITLATSIAAPLYASLFLATDMVAERSGAKAARNLVWVGFASQLILVVIGQLVLLFDPLDTKLEEAHQLLFSFAPKLAFASLLAYLVAQNLDIWIFETVRKLTQQRYPALRNLVSTAISQLVDTFIVFSIAFSSQIENWVEVMFATYLIKLLVSLLDTPFFLVSRRLATPQDQNSPEKREI